MLPFICILIHWRWSYEENVYKDLFVIFHVNAKLTSTFFNQLQSLKFVLDKYNDNWNFSCYFYNQHEIYSVTNLK